jgi:hypothetical protein
MTLLFLATSFADSSRATFHGISPLLLSVLILSFRVLKPPRKLFQLYVSLASLTFCLELLFIIWYPEALWMDAIAKAAYTMFLGISTVVLSRRIFRQRRVTADMLQGSICVYLLLGYLWFSLYSLLQTFDPDAFSIMVERRTEALLFFSFTTLSTVGYGDIVPVNSLAMALANLQGIIGVIYPAVFIARLVSLYTTQMGKDDSLN